MNAVAEPCGESFRLDAETAADLMMPNPISLQVDAKVREALMLFTDKNISGIPILDNGGQPIGVLSRSDLLVHDHECAPKAGPSPTYFFEQEVEHDHKAPEKFQIEVVNNATVGDLMTPAVFSVRPDTPIRKAIHEMVGLRVHRLFVVDSDGVLVGVISTLDILKHLR